MPQFLGVVRQHITGVVGNDMYMYIFVANLTAFQQRKNFENRLRFDEIIVTIGWRVRDTV